MNSIMESVCGICTVVRNSTKNGITFHNLLTRIRKEFREVGIDISIRSNRKKTLHPEEFYVNAYYDSEDDQNHNVAIEVIIYHNFDKAIDWDTKHITDLLVQIFDAVIHEFKHQRQSRKRHYRVFWGNSFVTYDYLQDPDEIDAYALSIAIELCRSMGKHRALRYMPKFSSLSRFKMQDKYVSPNLYFYFKHFENTEDTTLKLLAKKVYIRLQKIDTDCIFL